MNRWVDSLNRLRATADATTLSSSQWHAGEAVVALLRAHNTVNLYGLPGTGKTYLGWALARMTGARLVPSPGRLAGLDRYGPVASRLGPGLPGHWPDARLDGVVIVDQCPDSRTKVRSFVSDVTDAGFRRAVVVTQAPISDHFPHVELRLTPDDLPRVLAGLAGAGWPVQAPARPVTSLWDLVWPPGLGNAELPIG